MRGAMVGRTLVLMSVRPPAPRLGPTLVRALRRMSGRILALKPPPMAPPPPTAQPVRVPAPLVPPLSVAQLVPLLSAPVPLAPLVSAPVPPVLLAPC